MNYIAEIKAFHDLVQIKQLSTGQIALWYALMYINNKCTWIEWFTVPNITLELNTGLSRSGIAKARNVLKQHNIIDFKANGTKATSYKLITMLNSNQDYTLIAKSNQVSKQDSNQVGKQDRTQDGVQSSKQDRTPLNKLNKTKQNNNTTTNIESTKYIDTSEKPVRDINVLISNTANNLSVEASRSGQKSSCSSSLSISQDDFTEIVKLYTEMIEIPNQHTADWITDMLQDYGVTWLKNAIAIANGAGRRNQKYIKGILQNWKTGGGMTLDRDDKCKQEEIKLDDYIRKRDEEILKQQAESRKTRGG